MLLRDIHSEPIIARRYMERYLNNGSPSGFTEKFTTSGETSPFSLAPSFRLWTAVLEERSISDIGAVPSWLRSGEIPLHPDMAMEPIIHLNARQVRESNITVTPTASARTVEVLDPVYRGYVKLNYNKLLGRVNRSLSRAHAEAALDVTEVLRAAARRNALPQLFSFFAESGARIATLQMADDTVSEWGTVFREFDLFSPGPSTAFLVPAFSLFATDRLRPDDPPLLPQLIALQEKPSEDYVYENIIHPIIACYFELLLRCALQFECNAQNIVLGFDRRWRITRVAFRDFESVDKDVSLAEDLRLDVRFGSYPFKCVHRDLYNYSIKHSFMYDFKLGEYVISPIVGLLDDVSARDRLTHRVKVLASQYVAQLPVGFFPLDGQWYSYANVVVDKNVRRPYVGASIPRYR